MSQSDVPGAAPGPDGSPQMSEEELRQYLGQMRSAPADAIVAEIVQSLLNVAQVKLGRKDGRLLIDTIAAVNDAARDRIDDEFTSQVDEALNQLRTAQVEAESEVEEAGAQGHVEQNDLGSQPQAAGAAGTPASSTAPQQPQQDPGSRLWTPGG